MLASFAGRFQIRVAVLHYQDRQLTTEHAQFVPAAPLEPERTVFLFNRGNHFEWAHANSCNCGMPACMRSFRRISASHMPYHLTEHDMARADASKAEANQTRVGTANSDQLAVLVEQLLEEFPEISPERADAALKLTKQNGRYSIYRAMKLLPGNEGAPLDVSDSGSVSSVTGDDSSSDEDSGDDGDVACKPAVRFTDDKDDDAEGDGGRTGSKRARVELKRHTSRAATEQTASNTDGSGGQADAMQHLRFAAQVASVASGRPVKEAYEALLKNIALYGDMQLATQRTCQELMEGPAKPQPLQPTLPASENGVSFTQEELQPAAKPPTVRELAKRSRTLNFDAAEESPLAPAQLFQQRLQAEMRKTGGTLTASQRLATAMRRTDDGLMRDAWNARKARDDPADASDDDKEKGATPASAALLDDTQTLGKHLQQTASIQKKSKAEMHASPAVRVAHQMRIKREQAAAAQGTTIVVGSSGTKLPTWRPGSEADGKGFTWKTKQRMVHAWEQYQLSEGLHAPKTFKSMIDPELVPSICAECDLEEGDWEVLDDVTLLNAIEERLRPHDSMDFTVQLRQIRFNGDEKAGTLTQRYRLFAELFLGKLSEAKAAGFQLPENVIKLTFTRAVAASPILQGWCEQYKWTTAAETHRRITNQLKMVDAYSTLTGMVEAKKQDQPVQPVVQVVQQNGPGHQQHQRNQRFGSQVQAAVNNAMAAYQQAHVQAHGQGGAQPAPASGGNVNFAQQTQPQRSLAPFPGLDARGNSWHTHSATLGCRANPCTAPFCQACGMHGHTVDECRKRIFNNPAINRSGYWTEQKPGCVPLRFPKPTVNAAVQAQAQQQQQSPSFPIPHTLHGVPQQPAGGAAINHSATQSPASQQGGAAGGNAQ
jgi:hypothetical protein